MGLTLSLSDINLKFIHVLRGLWVHTFSSLNIIPLYGYITVCLQIHCWRSFLVFGINLLFTLVCIFFFNEDVIFKSGKNLRAKLLDCMGKLCLTSHTGFYVDISSTKLFFKVFISDCILISFVWLFQLFCIFSQYLVFSFYLFYFSDSNTWVAISIFKFHFCDD